MPGSSRRGRPGDQRETVQDLLQVHDLPGKELRDREPDDIGRRVDVGDDAARLRAGQAARLGAESQHELVAVDGVDVEVDRDFRASGGGEPVQQRARRRAEVVRAERGDAPPDDVRDVVLGPCVQPGQGDPVRGDRGWQQRLHVGIAVPGQRGHCHGVKARVLAGRRPDVVVRVDPHDRQVIAVPAGEFGKRRDAYRALPAEGRDPRWIVLADDLQGRRELAEDDRLGLDAVAFL